MPNLKNLPKSRFERRWQGQLAEYVTTLTWSPDGILGASSASGEVQLWRDNELISLRSGTGESIDCLAFSPDGQFLAAGGQNGSIILWQCQDHPKKIVELNNAPHWVDQLSWCPDSHLFAFNLGKYVQIWSADSQSIVTTLDFEASSVLGMSWRPNGEQLAIAGNQGLKVWDSRDWDDDPYLVSLPAASITVAWSPDGYFLASSSLDQTISVVKWGSPHPWVMRGFPGKIRCAAWSDSINGNPPLLAVSSVDGIVVWTKNTEDNQGWEAKVLTSHEGVIQGLAFQPHSLLLASVADEGWLCLWTKAKRLGQVFKGKEQGFSCLEWDRKGDLLAVGGQGGELSIWSKSSRGQGFLS